MHGKKSREDGLNFRKWIVKFEREWDWKAIKNTLVQIQNNPDLLRQYLSEY